MQLLSGLVHSNPSFNANTMLIIASYAYFWKTQIYKLGIVLIWTGTTILLKLYGLSQSFLDTASIPMDDFSIHDSSINSRSAYSRYRLYNIHLHHQQTRSLSHGVRLLIKSKAKTTSQVWLCITSDYPQELCTMLENTRKTHI